MSDVPVATPVVKPDAGLTVATLVVPEVQFEDAVTSRDDPSPYVAVAVNCWVAVTGIEAVAGVTLMDTTWGANQFPVPPPHPVIKKPLKIKINGR
jgi:hypothetical protein